MKTRATLLLLMMFIFIQCKTTEEIQREQRVDQISDQFSTSQKITADMTTRMNHLEEDSHQLRGKLEELEHAQSNNEEIKTQNTKINQLNQRIELLETKLGETEIQLASLSEEITKLKERPQPEEKSEKPIHKKNSGHKEAFELFKNKQYLEAKNIFLETFNNKKAPMALKEEAMNFLGIIEYRIKNYNESLIYLSKLYTEYPKSKHAEQALLYLGKNFLALKEKVQAKSSLEELIQKFPSSKFSKEAKELLNKITSAKKDS
ncbi:MAG: tetratricopeptide repeat protein [Bacteriovoracaceae bacterium]